MYNETKQKNKQKCQIYSNTVNMFVLVTIVFSEDSELEKKYLQIFKNILSLKVCSVFLVRKKINLDCIK